MYIYRTICAFLHSVPPVLPCAPFLPLCSGPNLSVLCFNCNTEVGTRPNYCCDDSTVGPEQVYPDIIRVDNHLFRISHTPRPWTPFTTNRLSPSRILTLQSLSIFKYMTSSVCTSIDTFSPAAQTNSFIIY